MLIKRLTGFLRDLEDVHDTTGDPSCSPPGKRIDISGPDIQAEGRKQPAKNRESRRIVVADNGNPEFALALLLDPQTVPSFVIDRDRHPQMLRDLVRWKRLKVVVVHPAQKVFDEIGAHVG